LVYCCEDHIIPNFTINGMGVVYRSWVDSW
jgi:hypothetical protein